MQSIESISFKIHENLFRFFMITKHMPLFLTLTVYAVYIYRRIFSRLHMHATATAEVSIWWDNFE